MKYISRTLLTATLALALCAVESQAQVKVQEKPEISYTANHPKYVLGGLTVDGPKNFDQDLLLNISGLTVGETYEVPGAEITEAIRRYWKQKLFSNVKIEADSIVGGKIYLHVILTAHPRISSINYSGVKKSEREDIEQRLGGFQAGNQITPDVVDRAKLIIKRYYEDKGFKNAEVEIAQHEDITGDNRVLVDINIKKNEKVKVSKIYITGISDPKQVSKLKLAMKKTHE